MKFVEAIHLALQKSTTVITALGTGGASKIFQSFVAPTTSMPFIVVSAQSDDAINPTINGTGDVVRLATIAIDCISKSMQEASNIADHVRVDLYGAKGTLATTTNSPMTIQNIRIEGTSLAYDLGGEGTEYGAFVCSVNMKIWYVASSPSAVTLTSGI
jgi:hypothetical protein